MLYQAWAGTSRVAYSDCPTWSDYLQLVINLRPKLTCKWNHRSFLRMAGCSFAWWSHSFTSKFGAQVSWHIPICKCMWACLVLWSNSALAQASSLLPLWPIPNSWADSSIFFTSATQFHCSHSLGLSSLDHSPVPLLRFATLLVIRNRGEWSPKSELAVILDPHNCCATKRDALRRADADVAAATS